VTAGAAAVAAVTLLAATALSVLLGVIIAVRRAR
jgi:hypothetical protein